MGLRFRGTEVVVTTIIPGSPAALGGVCIGDVVLAVANEILLKDAPENVWVDVARFAEEQLPSLIAGNVCVCERERLRERERERERERDVC